MTIFELIEELRQFDPDAEVKVSIARPGAFFDPDDLLDIEALDNSDTLIAGVENETAEMVIIEVV